MIKPERNSFYKKQKIGTDSAIKLSAMFKDISLYENDIMTLEGGMNASKFLVSGSIPSQPEYGDADLKGAHLVCFCSGSDLSSLGRMPMVSSYRLKEDIVLTEGNMAFSTSGAGGQNLYLFTTYADPSQPFMVEDFDGISRDFGGNVKIIGTDGTGPTVMENPYMTPTDAARTIYLGGTYSMFHWGDEVGGGGGSSGFLVNYFSDTVGRIYIKPLNKSKLHGKWTCSVDNRTDYDVYTVFRPIWRWNDIKGLVSFGDTTPSVLTATTPPSDINTAFKLLYKTANQSTAFSADASSEPWVVSELDMSSEEFRSGGQSLHMMHMWTFSEGTATSDLAYGLEGRVNTQIACASAELLPYPLPLDYSRITTSGATQYWNSASGNDGSAMIKPEVDITFKITELPAALQAYSGGPGDAPLSLNLYDYVGWDAHNAAGTGFAYDDCYQSNTAWTMLRAFTVTLSSYLPDPNENLDEFIDRGMTEFYVNQNYEQGIIGGVTFRRNIANAATLGADQPDDTSSLFSATPLLTRASAYRHKYAGSGKSDGATDQNPTNRMFRLISGSGAVTPGGEDVNAMVMCHFNTSYPIDRGFGRGIQPGAFDSAAIARCEPSVACGMNEWTTIKIVLDPLGENSGAQPGLGRIYFTEGVYDTNTLVPLYDADMPPSIQLYFPASGNDASPAGGAPMPTADNMLWPYVNSGAAASTNGNWNWVDHPEYWPRFVTFWLSNYRYIDPDNVEFGRQDEVADTNIFVGEFPEGTGATKTAEVFIDNITLRNFSNESLNNSAGAAYLSKPISIRDRGVKCYVDSNGVLAYPESAGQGASGTISNNDPSATYTATSSAITTCHAPTYLSIGFESGATDLPSRFTASGTAGSLPGAYMLWNGFSTPSFDNIERQDEWTTHASFMSLTGTGWGGGGSPRASSGINRLGFWHTNRGVNTMHDYQNTLDYGADITLASGSLRTPNPNARNNKLKIVTDNSGWVPQGGYNYAGGFQLGTSTDNSFLSTDGMTQKGFMKFISSGMVTDGDTNGNWVKMVNPLVVTKIIGLPQFEIGAESAFYTNRAVIVDNPEIFNEVNVGDTEYVIFTATGGAISDLNLTGTANLSARRSMVLKQERPKEGDVIFFNYDVRSSVETDLSAICHSKNLPYLYVAPLKYWINMEIFPGKQLQLIDEAQAVAPYLSGSTGADKMYDGIALIGDASTTDADIIASTGSTYNEELFFYNAGARAQKGRSQNYGNPWELETGDNLLTSLVVDQDYGFGAYSDEDQTGGEAAVETVFQDKTFILNYDKVIEVWQPAPQSSFGVTIGLHEPAATHSLTMYGNDYSGSNSNEYRPYFAYRYQDPLPSLSSFAIEPAINLLEEDNLYELDEESLNAVKFSWSVDADDLWYTMLHITSGTVSNKYTDSFLWAPLNEIPLNPTGAVTYKWYNIGYGSSSPKPSGNFTISGGALLQTIDGMAGYAPLFAEAGYLSVTSSNISSSTGGIDGVSGLDEFTVVAHATPDGATAGNSYYYLQNTGSAGSAAGGGFAIWLDQVGITHAQMGIATGTADKTTQGHMQSISKNTMDGETPLTVMVTYSSGSSTGPDFKLFVNGVMEDYVRTGIPNPDCSGTHIYVGSGCLGTVEEVIAYDKVIYMPQTEGEHFFDTSDLLDKQSDGKAINYQARIFAMDYHNIRGKDPMQVARSKPVSWRVSSV